MKKILKRTGIGVVILIVALLLIIILVPGHLVRVAIQKGGSSALGVPVRLDKAAIGLFSGTIELEGFTVENPEGYTTEKAIGVKRIHVTAPVFGLLGAKPRIESIIVEAPEVTLERKGRGTNLGDFVNNAGKTQTEGAEKKEGGKRLTIGSLRISDAKVNLELNLPQTPSKTLSLPLIELKEIGGEGNRGATISQVMAIVVNAIAKSSVVQGKGILPRHLSGSLNSNIAAFDNTRKQFLSTAGGMKKTATDTAGGLQKSAVDIKKGALKEAAEKKRGLLETLKEKEANVDKEGRGILKRASEIIPGTDKKQ